VPKALLFGTLIMVAYIQLDGKELKKLISVITSQASLTFGQVRVCLVVG
jgi:hypothetical protein